MCRIDFIRHVGSLWLCIGIGGGLFRVAQLGIIQDLQTGLIWAFKVLTDPFHNIALYYTAPLALLRGELIDTTISTAVWTEDDAEEASRPT